MPGLTLRARPKPFLSDLGHATFFFFPACQGSPSLPFQKRSFSLLFPDRCCTAILPHLQISRPNQGLFQYLSAQNGLEMQLYNTENLEVYLRGARSGPTGININSDTLWHHLAVTWTSKECVPHRPPKCHPTRTRSCTTWRSRGARRPQNRNLARDLAWGRPGPWLVADMMVYFAGR